MNHAYSGDLWGEAVPGALSTHLEGNQAVIHSRTTNVYGVLDNDDFYDYAGGLNAATKTANGGNAPAFYVNDMKTRGKERVTGIQTFLATELNARYWNPKWIQEMQKAGYAGRARHRQQHGESLRLASHIRRAYGRDVLAEQLRRVCGR